MSKKLDVKKIFFLEKNTLISRLYLFFSNNKIGSKIYYFHSYQIDGYRGLTKKNKKFDELEISHSLEQQFTYKGNKLSFQEVEDYKEKFIFKYFENHKISNKIFIAFAKYYREHISRKIRKQLVVEYLINNYSDDYKLIVFQSDSNFINHQKYRKKNIRIICTSLFILFPKLISMTLLFLYLPFWLIKNLFMNGYKFGKTRTKNFKFGFHFSNNIFKREEINIKKNELVISRNDNFLPAKLNIDIKDLVYVFSSWEFKKIDMERNQNEIQKSGVSTCHEFKNPVNFKIVCKFFSFYLSFIREIIPKIISDNLDYYSLRSLTQVVRDILIIEKFCQNYRIENFYSRDDFNAIHIVRTIIFNKNGLKNNGIAHSMFFLPETSILFPYTYFNTHFIQGNFYYDLYKNYWYSDEFRDIGPLYGTLVSKALNNTSRKNSFIKKYSNCKKYLWLTFPLSKTNVFDSEKNNLKNIRNLLSILEIDKNSKLFIVPRLMSELDDYANMLNNYSKYKNRIIFDSSYSTYEYLAYCDYLITSETSSSNFEAAYNPNLSIIPFNARGITDSAWKKFPNIKICRNDKEIFQLISQTKYTDNPINNHEISQMLK